MIKQVGWSAELSKDNPGPNAILYSALVFR
jgi:hypothetical protein